MAADIEEAIGDDLEDAESERVQSKKIEVIEIIFERLGGSEWPPARPMIVDSDVLVKAIEERNRRHAGKGKALSTKTQPIF